MHFHTSSVNVRKKDLRTVLFSPWHLKDHATSLKKILDLLIAPLTVTARHLPPARGLCVHVKKPASISRLTSHVLRITTMLTAGSNTLAGQTWSISNCVMKIGNSEKSWGSRRE